MNSCIVGYKGSLRISSPSMTRSLPQKANPMPRSTVAKPSASRRLKKTAKRVAPAVKRARAYTPAKRPTSELASLLGTGEESQDTGDMPTARQMEIYDFIREKIYSRGFGPTVREIGQAFDIRSPNGVVCHLKALEKKGLITRGRNMSRAIELVTESPHSRGLQMAGWVAAGTLRAAEEQRERFDFEELFDRDGHFVLKVMGDSMIDAQIADGDWVIIEKRNTARTGEIVVAQTEDGEATLKQWFPERDRIRLQPANAAMKPIYVRSAKVLGVLAGVVRKT